MLVHYLNVPYPDDNKLVIACSITLFGDIKKEWTKEELISQLKPMCKFLKVKMESWYSNSFFLQWDTYLWFEIFNQTFELLGVIHKACEHPWGRGVSVMSTSGRSAGWSWLKGQIGTGLRVRFFCSFEYRWPCIDQGIHKWKSWSCLKGKNYLCGFSFY